MRELVGPPLLGRGLAVAPPLLDAAVWAAMRSGAIAEHRARVRPPPAAPATGVPMDVQHAHDEVTSADHAGGDERRVEQAESALRRHG